MRRVERPIARPAMAPGVRWWWLGWICEGAFGFVAGADGWGEWSMVTMLEGEFTRDSAWETEKFRCS